MEETKVFIIKHFQNDIRETQSWLKEYHSGKIKDDTQKKTRDAIRVHLSHLKQCLKFMKRLEFVDPPVSKQPKNLPSQFMLTVDNQLNLFDYLENL